MTSTDLGPVSMTLEADVRDSIRRVKASPFIPKKDEVRGFVYDVKTGRLSEVS